MALPKFKNWSEYLYWVYASLNMLMFASRQDKKCYDRSCFALRQKRFKDYKEGNAQIQSLLRNNIWKTQAPQDVCWYCHRPVSECGKLSVDHVLPKSKGGGDEFDNLAFCCRECNSSKGDRDLVEWSVSRFDAYPSMFMCCIYLKLVYMYSLKLDLMEAHYNSFPEDVPFSVQGVESLLALFVHFFDEDGT